MNNTFNINRFGKLLALDGRKYFRNFGITLAILSGLTLVLWLLTLIFSFTTPAFFRWLLIYTAVILAIIMVPAKAFGDINLSHEGVRFAMLPVSNLEKYLSYAIFCIMTPVLVVLFSWGLDSLLTALPFGGYHHYIKSFGIIDSFEKLFTEIDDVTNEEGFMEFKQFNESFGPSFLYNLILGLFFNIGIFMLGNLLFKTHKTGKTLACMIGISYLLTMIMQVFIMSRGIYPWFIEAQGNTTSFTMDIESLRGVASHALLIRNLLQTLLTIGLYIGIFFKLKTQKY